MPPHIDRYGYKGDWFEGEIEWKDPQRLVEGETAIRYGKSHPLPNFNGYVYLTPVHEDGECGIHQPELPEIQIRIIEGEYKLPKP